MARSLWKGAISFGLVNIPVELFPAEERKGFQFSMLDKRDLSPVGYKRYSKKSGKEVQWADIVKGYEYEKDQYVVLSDEDFRRANVKASRTIEAKRSTRCCAKPCGRPDASPSRRSSFARPSIWRPSFPRVAH